MSNVLLCYYSDYGEAMYDALLDELLNNGNNVFRFNINNDGIAIDKWGGKSKVLKKSIIDQILAFNPDIVLNFNNSLPIEIFEMLDEECSVCVIDADNPSTFWNKDYLKQHYSDYYYLGLQSCSKGMYSSFFDKELVDNENYIYFPPGTAVVREDLEKDKNISFIGSNFYPLAIPQGEDFYSKMGLDLYDAVKNNYYITLEEVRKICPLTQSPEWMLENIRAYYVGQDRLRHLQVLTDLGLKFYGVRWWNHIAYYDLELAKCFDQTPIVTLKDNQWVYNTSKISVNISHPQAKSSFSWRVMDIMASSSCLLMEEKEDWLELFSDYLSSETIENMIYYDIYDMRNKAIKLLEDEDLRNKCVSELNNAIDNNGRWIHRLKKLEKLLGKKITSIDNPKTNNESIGLGLSTTAVVNPYLFDDDKIMPILFRCKQSLSSFKQMIFNHIR